MRDLMQAPTILKIEEGCEKTYSCSRCGLRFAVNGTEALSYSVDEWGSRCPRALLLGSAALCQYLIGRESSNGH